jgi:hypothetical protein
MADFILTDTDMAIFIPMFGPAIVVAVPGIFQATSSNVKINGKKIVLEGDEKNISVPTAYIQGQYVIPGQGLEKISALAGNQKTSKVKCNGKAMVLKGMQFTAEFQVNAPAQQPQPPAGTIPDSNPKYSGNGTFVPTNMTVRAS